ncbi:MAG: ABC transporter substrate-binding protein [Gemmatimonadota bacterium]
MAFGLLAILACRDPEPYRIGVVLTATGNPGAVLATEFINRNGGIGGVPLVLVNLGDSPTGSAPLALDAAERLVADPRVLAVVGHSNSSASLAASQVYNSRHVVQIAPTSTTPLFNRAGPWSFRLVASDEYQAPFIAAAVAAEHPDRVAVVYVNDVYGRSLNSLLAHELEKSKIAVVATLPYVETESANQSDLVSSLAKYRPTLLVWLGRSAYFDDITAPLGKALPGLRVLASDGFGGRTARLDSSVLGEVRHVRLVDMNRADTTLQRVRQLYREREKTEINDEAALSYDAVLLLAEAIRRVGPDRARVREWLSHVGRDAPAYNGITGPIAFVNGGSRKAQYSWGIAHAASPVPRRAP